MHVMFGNPGQFVPPISRSVRRPGVPWDMSRVYPSIIPLRMLQSRDSDPGRYSQLLRLQTHLEERRRRNGGEPLIREGLQMTKGAGTGSLLGKRKAGQAFANNQFRVL